MSLRYKHTQIGTVLLIVLGVVVVLTLFMHLQAKQAVPFVVISGVLLIIAGLFASLTVEIRDGLLCWRFGLGLIRFHHSLADIKTADVIRNPWWYGLGIHITPRGWLYNVSGLRGVEITLKSGRCFRLGTDEPEKLARAVKEALSAYSV